MKKNYFKRGAGILLHISSLPNEYGIGSMGRYAYEFIDFLHNAGQRYWQILPLNPTGISNSPYQSYSAFAFNPNFIDLEFLLSDGLLTAGELNTAKREFGNKVDYCAVNKGHGKLLKKAFTRFDSNCEAFLKFKATKKYLDYACFMSLKKRFNSLSWHLWDINYKLRNPKTIKSLLIEAREEIDFHLWTQFAFLNQWHSLKEYANSKGISIIGDMPIYLDYDSDTSWANNKLLQLDENLEPKAVAGVPPDYFSETGQLWGNPLYDWDYHRKSGFKWWKKRIYDACDIFDYVRIDHFRGFYEYYSIPADEKTAINGIWRKGAGTELFELLSPKIKRKIIAEDLGLLDEGALQFFKTLGFPGMKVLQFAFDGSMDNPHLPMNYSQNSLVYTGTHDNDTLKGWLLSTKDINKVKEILINDGSGVKLDGINSINGLCQFIIEIALNSISNICIVPIQDYLFLDSKDRFNIPGTVNDSNWSYRLKAIPHKITGNLKKAAKKYKRI